MAVNIDELKAVLANFKPGVSQDVLDAAVADLNAKIDALGVEQAADAAKFAAIQAALDANAAGDATEEEAIEVIKNALVPPTT